MNEQRMRRAHEQNIVRLSRLRQILNERLSGSEIVTEDGYAYGVGDYPGIELRLQYRDDTLLGWKLTVTDEDDLDALLGVSTEIAV